MAWYLKLIWTFFCWKVGIKENLPSQFLRKIERFLIWLDQDVLFVYWLCSTSQMFHDLDKGTVVTMNTFTSEFYFVADNW